MWPFSKTNTNYVLEMHECLKQYMLAYLKENPSSGDDVIPIFSSADEMIRGLTEREVSKMMKQNHVNTECGALNILQNFAMTEIKPVSSRDYIIGNTDPAYKLYCHINKAKFNKGYISKKQYDENELLGTKLGMSSPFGTGWL